MLKKFVTRAKEVMGKGKSKLMAVTAGGSALALVGATNSGYAANADLDKAVTSLTTGIGDMLAAALVIVAAVIGVFVVIYGIMWLVNVVKKGMAKA